MSSSDSVQPMISNSFVGGNPTSYKDCVEAVGTLDSTSLTEDQLVWARSLKDQFVRDHSIYLFIWIQLNKACGQNVIEAMIREVSDALTRPSVGRILGQFYHPSHQDNRPPR